MTGLDVCLRCGQRFTERNPIYNSGATYPDGTADDGECRRCGEAPRVVRDAWAAAMRLLLRRIGNRPVAVREAARYASQAALDLGMGAALGEAKVREKVLRAAERSKRREAALDTDADDVAPDPCPVCAVEGGHAADFPNRNPVA